MTSWPPSPATLTATPVDGLDRSVVQAVDGHVDGTARDAQRPPASSSRLIALAQPYAPMTTHDLACMIQRYLPSEDNALLCCAEFLDEYRDAPDEVHDQLLAPEPRTTGDQRWDSLPAAFRRRGVFITDDFFSRA
jgi:hypothetical protein